MSRNTHLQPSERDQIAQLRAQGFGPTAIGRAIGRCKSVVSRELRRNALDDGAYRAERADGKYLSRRQREARLERDEALQEYTRQRLSEGWTPEQIAGRLRKGLEQGLATVCAETIYRWIYSAACNGDKLWKQLVRCHNRRGWRKRPSGDRIKEKINISERSADVETRNEAGHWEADLMICRKSRPVLVLHERKTRITLISRLCGKTAAETVSVMMAMLQRLSPSMRKSITMDNGGEFARHTMLRSMLSATTYFCDAYASWQKGSVENTNGRLRRWLPRSTDLDQVSDEELQEIAMTLNTTPRKCLGFSAPIEACLKELGRDVQISFR